MKRFCTQGRLAIDALKTRPHTYLEMLKLGVGCSPWKRVSECLRAHEKLVKGKRYIGPGKYLITWAVKRNEDAI